VGCFAVHLALHVCMTLKNNNIVVAPGLGKNANCKQTESATVRAKLLSVVMQ